MEKKEKAEFILEQMRLCLAKKDYIRTQIISKKITTKFFDEPGTEVRGSRVRVSQANVSQCDGHFVLSPYACCALLLSRLGPSAQVLSTDD